MISKFSALASNFGRGIVISNLKHAAVDNRETIATYTANIEKSLGVNNRVSNGKIEIFMTCAKPEPPTRIRTDLKKSEFILVFIKFNTINLLTFHLRYFFEWFTTRATAINFFVRDSAKLTDSLSKQIMA